MTLKKNQFFCLKFVASPIKLCYKYTWITIILLNYEAYY